MRNANEDTERGKSNVNASKFDGLIKSLGITKGTRIEIWVKSGAVSVRGTVYGLSTGKRSFHIGTTYQGHDKYKVKTGDKGEYVLLDNIIMLDRDRNA